MMYRIVIDTNVLVSALRSAAGASHKLLRLIDRGKFEVNLSVPLVFEYESALKADRVHSGLSGEDIDSVLDYLCKVAGQKAITYLWRPCLKDPKDDFVLEHAVESEADFIVTFNKKDFKGSERFGIRTMNPREFLKKIGEIK